MRKQWIYGAQIRFFPSICRKWTARTISLYTENAIAKGCLGKVAKLFKLCAIWNEFDSKGWYTTSHPNQFVLFRN